MELNTIHNMDCREGIRQIADNSIDLLVMDPPYFIGMTHNGQKGDYSDLAVCKPFYMDLAKEIKRVLKATAEFYIFCDWRTYAFYYPIFAEELNIKNLIVWDKISGPGSVYSYQHELIIYGQQCNKIKKGTNIWQEKSFASGAKKTNGEKMHPTQKPVELIERIIKNSSQEGDTVLDLFAGSGTTAVACINTDRKYICFELQEKYCRISDERTKNAKLCSSQIGSHEGGM